MGTLPMLGSHRDTLDGLGTSLERLPGMLGKSMPTKTICGGSISRPKRRDFDGSQRTHSYVGKCACRRVGELLERKRSKPREVAAAFPSFLGAVSKA